MLYSARRGDTLVTISDRFGVSLDQLRRWNKVTGIKVEPGRRLHVSEPASAPRATRSHRRASSAETHDESGAKAHGKASSKASSHKPAPRSSAKKERASSAKSGQSKHPIAKRKSSARKQK
jgi:membrane-bound lytic murein transglycosylase D